MKKRRDTPKTIQEAIQRWCELLKDLKEDMDKESSEDLAGHMVGANIYSGDEEKWYQSEPLFAEVFDIVADLEIDNLDPENREKERRDKWDRVKELVERLEEKYKVK